jgi:hypothetical protein
VIPQGAHARHDFPSATLLGFMIKLGQHRRPEATSVPQVLSSGPLSRHHGPCWDWANGRPARFRWRVAGRSWRAGFDAKYLDFPAKTAPIVRVVVRIARKRAVRSLDDEQNPAQIWFLPSAPIFGGAKRDSQALAATYS